VNPMKYPQSYLALEAAQFDRQPRMAPPLTWDDREAEQIPSYEQTAISPDPLIDLGAGFSGGFGANIMRKGLSSALRSGIAATLAEYPIGLATAGAANIDPRLAMPVSIIGGMASGPTFERALSNAMAGKAHPVRTARRALVNQQGLFGGLKAKGRDMGQYRNALEMQRSFSDNEEIRRATGWFKGLDDKWRFEINDRDAVIHTEVFSDLAPDNKRFVGELGHVLEHDDLFKNYPEAKAIQANLKIDPSIKKPRGEFSEGYPDTDEYFGRDPEINLIAPDENSAKKTILHELQHFIQKQENFAKGSSPAASQRGPLDIKRLKDEQKAVDDELIALAVKYKDGTALISGFNRVKNQDLLADPNFKYLLEKKERMIRKIRRIEQDPARDNFDRYLRSAGEIEARAAARRANITAWGRKRIRPFDDTVDPAVARPIVDFYGPNNAMQIPMLPPPETAKQHLARATARHDAWKKKASRMADQAGKKPVVLTERGTNKRGVIIHKSTKRPGKYQITYWDDRGFSGDTQADSLKKAIEEALQERYETINPNAFNKAVKSKRFAAYTKANDLFHKNWAGGEKGEGVIALGP
jgi:hypothetical protein